MLLEGRIITDGMDLIAYLDTKLDEITAIGHTSTGIIIGTVARRHLSDACQKVMGQKLTKEITVNKFRGLLLIEDGVNPERMEVIHAEAPTMPVEGNPFKTGLKRIGR
jgi:hypothetical protein